MKIYLAGKIGPSDWRHSIVKGLRNVLDHDYDAFYIYQKLEWPILPKAILDEHDYVGPYFLGCDHSGFHGPNTHGYGGAMYPDGMGEDGDFRPSCCRLEGLTYGKSHDLIWLGEWGDNVAEEVRKARIVELCKRAIRKCDLFFIWMDNPEIFGTLVETGIASALGKPIYVAFGDNAKTDRNGGFYEYPHWYHDMWFARELATHEVNESVDPVMAVAEAISHRQNILTGNNNKPKRQKIKSNLRFQIFKRDEFCCRICGARGSKEVELEVDHIVPVSKGGSNSSDNLWTLCFECNRGKSTQLLN